MVSQLILLMIGAYLLGSVPSAYLALKWSRGVDIRQQGTGNVGASNVLSTGSKWLVVPVALFDIGKGVLSVWAAHLLDMGTAQQITVGICAIIGHNWPVFLHFRGGRGVLASLGVITMMSPKLGLIALVMSYLLAPFRQVALGVFLALAALPLFAWFLSQPLDIADRLPVTLGFVVIALIGYSKRLLAPRTPLSRSMPLGKLLLNRLLFDRDIADRKAWINRLRPEEDLPDQVIEQREEQS
ncbi:MAG TPA: glycerol-3-phosphate acyltransferase [Dehalococcoidales bacterium]|nr:glycerol-3-phosphate acyltransferase [Dehalococcoidales bacterium]